MTDNSQSDGSKTPELPEPPRWITSWPDWYGITGNVKVVPCSDYEALERQLAEVNDTCREYEKRLQEIQRPSLAAQIERTAQIDDQLGED